MSDDSTTSAEDTGQVSVAELLARNGQRVGDAGGRRRRGVAGGISVAELTGEIPVVPPEPAPVPEPAPAAPRFRPTPPPPSPRSGADDVDEEEIPSWDAGPVDTDVSVTPNGSVVDEPAAVTRKSPAESAVPRVGPTAAAPTPSAAFAPASTPQRTRPPTPVIEDADTDVDIAGVSSRRPASGPAEPDVAFTDEFDDAPEIEAPDESADAPLESVRRSPARQWMSMIGQGVVAVVLGALLFKGFERLWDVLPWVALVLSFFVIVGLVAVVRVLRRTDDIVSILLAVLVGSFVTLGPLAFMLSTT